MCLCLCVNVNGKWLPDFIERLKASTWHQLYLPLLPFTHARSEYINADCACCEGPISSSRLPVWSQCQTGVIQIFRNFFDRPIECNGGSKNRQSRNPRNPPKFSVVPVHITAASILYSIRLFYL